VNELNKLKKEFILKYIEQCSDLELDNIFKKCAGINDNVPIIPIGHPYPVYPIEPYVTYTNTEIKCDSDKDKITYIDFIGL
jgi:hypothetical protein